VRISRIKLYMVNVPERRWWWSDDTYGQPQHQKDEHGIAEVETDAGITGLTQIERGTPAPIMRENLERWIGTDVLQVNLAERRPVMTGSFEQAVLDIRGQALGVPLWQLLGGRLRGRISVTQCTGYKTPEHTAEDAMWGWEHGFRAYKMKCITAAENTPELKIEYVMDRVEAIHRVLPDMVVRPDLRWRLDQVWVAQELARRLQGHRIDCIESPIGRRTTSNYAEWRRLRHSIHLPLGDHVAEPEQLLRVFNEEAVDYAIVGSLSYLDTISRSQLAADLGMGGWSQTVSYGPGAAMGIHVAACMPHLTQPYDMVGPLAWEDTLVNEDFPFEDGSFLVPNRPGLGYTLNHQAVDQYLISTETFDGVAK
jgi:L-alanine-DL-glutamate epimerase-like enolase superfamily enzyme